jgi:serine/threonine protein kinase
MSASPDNAAPSDSPTLPETDLLPSAPIAETEGSLIGRYKLLQVIGEGGFGVVYMAEQTEPVIRRVALKIIKLGMDTRQVIARFEAERQALALMDHPNIAKVLDAGATDTGRPYFVMELVKGVPITKYCDDHKLSTEDRLRLFLDVCHAIQHAHQKGIIHRDIKPSNILVTLHDGKPVPKVIDFGIAKATQTKLTDKTLFTRYEQIIGTPAYMSPEQAEMSGLDIDTRTDIYSLGVLLYELLTGTTPFDTKQLLSVGLDEMRRIIREQEPIRPSTRVSAFVAVDDSRRTSSSRQNSSALPVPEASAGLRRPLHSENLLKALRRDLDWIVLKCLEKDRSRRYETVAALRLDIVRYINDQPVSAVAPTFAYQLQKVYRRRKTFVHVAAIAATLLVLAASVSTLAFLRERSARLAAGRAEFERNEARRATESETIKAESLTQFLSEFFDGAIPALHESGHHESIRDLLNVASRVAARLTNAPMAEAQLRMKIGFGFNSTSLSDYTAAIPQYEAAERLAAQLGSQADGLRLRAKGEQLDSVMWRDSDPEAARQLLALGDAAANSLPILSNLATFAYADVSVFESSHGDAAKAERYALRALDYSPLASADLDALHYRLWALDTLALLYADRNDWAKRDAVAAEIFATLQAPAIRDERVRRELVDYLLMVHWGSMNVFHLPQAPVRRAVEHLSSPDGAVRRRLASFLAGLVARDGDWNAALELFKTSLDSSVQTSWIWRAAIELAALAGDTSLQRTLTLNSLILLGNQPGAEKARDVVAPLLIQPPDPAFLPMIERLVRSIANGPPWTRALGKLQQALLDYHLGRHQTAEALLQDYLKTSETPWGRRLPCHWTAGWFLRAMNYYKLGDFEAASRAYDHAVVRHRTATPQRGSSFAGTDWNGARTAELLRREAESLLAKTN